MSPAQKDRLGLLSTIFVHKHRAFKWWNRHFTQFLWANTQQLIFYERDSAWEQWYLMSLYRRGWLFGFQPPFLNRSSMGLCKRPINRNFRFPWQAFLEAFDTRSVHIVDRVCLWDDYPERLFSYSLKNYCDLTAPIYSDWCLHAGFRGYWPSSVSLHNVHRKPEETNLYKIIGQNLPIIQSHPSNADISLPAFVHNEFCSYLRCGDHPDHL